MWYSGVIMMTSQWIALIALIGWLLYSIGYGKGETYGRKITNWHFDPRRKPTDTPPKGFNDLSD